MGSGESKTVCTRKRVLRIEEMSTGHKIPTGMRNVRVGVSGYFSTIRPQGSGRRIVSNVTPIGTGATPLPTTFTEHSKLTSTNVLKQLLILSVI